MKIFNVNNLFGVRTRKQPLHLVTEMPQTIDCLIETHVGKTKLRIVF
jgi:hypothetical protein